MHRVSLAPYLVVMVVLSTVSAFDVQADPTPARAVTQCVETTPLPSTPPIVARINAQHATTGCPETLRSALLNVGAGDVAHTRRADFDVALPDVVPTSTRRAWLRAAAARGRVLLESTLNDGRQAYALYLGHFDQHDWVLTDHACNDRGCKQVALTIKKLNAWRWHHVNRLLVTGRGPGWALRGVARVRSPAPVAQPLSGACAPHERSAMLVSPAHPHPGQALRVIATLDADPGPAELVWFAPNGQRAVAVQQPVVEHPLAFVATQPSPSPGVWTAVLGDGDTLYACAHVTVHPTTKRHPSVVQRTWNDAMERHFAVFVATLFASPDDLEHTWSGLRPLLQDPTRNLLHDHWGQGEDDAIRAYLVAGDLPIFLRAYFAWKLNLPNGYRQCSKGSTTQPPRCGTLRPRTGSRPHTTRGFKRDTRALLRATHAASYRYVPHRHPGGGWRLQTLPAPSLRLDGCALR